MSQISVTKRNFSRREKGKARAFLYNIVSLSLSLFGEKERERKERSRGECAHHHHRSLFFVLERKREKREREREKSIQLTRVQNTKKSRKNNEKFFFKTQKLTVYPTRRFRRVSSQKSRLIQE